MIDNFLKLSSEDQRLLIINTSEKINMAPALVEKDLWVCFMLDYLFRVFKYRDFICFKGGTSLSKVFNCIERFSEDIDISLDWSVIGVIENEAYAFRSNRQHDLFNKNINKKAEDYIEKIMLPIIKNDLQHLLDIEFDLYIDQVDRQTICFQYPNFYRDESILQIIRLEIGPLAQNIPSVSKNVSSYISQYYPNIINKDKITVNVVDICRTFFEKITILHKEAHRTNNQYPSRYSRHYYDLYQIIDKGLCDEMLTKIELLKMVVGFNKKFYPCPWAKYDEILEGKCQLIPNDVVLVFFEKDYAKMANMIYGDYPMFSKIVESLKKFELKLNSTIKSNSNMMKIESIL